MIDVSHFTPQKKKFVVVTLCSSAPSVVEHQKLEPRRAQSYTELHRGELAPAFNPRWRFGTGRRPVSCVGLLRRSVASASSPGLSIPSGGSRQCRRHCRRGSIRGTGPGRASADRSGTFPVRQIRGVSRSSSIAKRRNLLSPRVTTNSLRDTTALRNDKNYKLFFSISTAYPPGRRKIKPC